uniref:PH domain-containing protein n=1 Tax=Steinernema glaseri TaxID=37863 RepID=A0A1I7Y2U9_9BILA
MAELAAAPLAEVGNRSKSSIPTLQSTPRRDVHGLGPRRLVEDLPPTPSRHDSEESASPAHSVRSPRYEAFVMTGDKMLHINHKISPSYAKVRQDQLPPNMDVNSDSNVRRGMFDDFPSVHKQRRLQKEYAAAIMSSGVQESQSQHILSGKADDMPTPRMENGGSVDGTENKEMANHAPEEATRTVQPSLAPQAGDADASSSLADNYSNSSTSNGADVHTNDDVNRSQPLSRNDDDRELSAVESLAREMFVLDGYTPDDITTILLRRDEYGGKVAIEFMKLFNVGGVRIDAALRLFLEKVALKGESSERARLLKKFSDRYQESNPDIFGSSDKVHALVCALILLNTDLHGNNVSKHMSSREFVNNLAHTEFQYECTLLKTLYSSVKDKPFVWNISKTSSGNRSKDASMCTLTDRINRQQSVLVHPSNMVEYKNGWVMRKALYDSDGKKTPIGRRSWRMLYATVRGLVLYLHKNEKGFQNGTFETYNNCIMLHHCLAEVPHDYKKKQHIFRLRTANLGEYLFQTSSPAEVQKWVDVINYVAAAFSIPVLSAPVSSKPEFFYKPSFPSQTSPHTLYEQLRAHNEKVKEMSDRLEKLRSEAPPLKSRGKVVYDYFYRERYLEGERDRYVTYARILEKKLDISKKTSTVGSRSLCAKDSEDSEDRSSYHEAIVSAK